MEQAIHYTFINPGLVQAQPVIGSYYLFEQESSLQNNTVLLDKQAEALDHGKALRCAYCKTVITYQGNAENRQGQHIHRFANPGGFEFTLGCFSRAWCQVIGLPMLEWSWFNGYAWQYALCPHCQEHLGWFYHCAADDSSFYGLILDRIIIESADGEEH